MGVGWFVRDLWIGSHAYVTIRGPDDAASVPVRLESFALDDRPHAPSPMPRLGAIELESGGTARLGGALLPGEALLRVTAPGHGVGFVDVRCGHSYEFVLGDAVSVTGRVTDPAGHGLVGARILVFGGGARGVLLGETVSAADGVFVIDGIAASVSHVTMRVVHDGFSITEVSGFLAERKAFEVQLQPTLPVVGRVTTDGAIPLRLQDLELRVFHVPGLQTRTDADGRFTLLYAPSGVDQFYLLASTLPAEFTHRRCAVSVGAADVELLVTASAMVRGRVVNGNNQLGVAGASVVHDHGPSGLEVATCDSGGWFEIGRVPPGPVTLRAEILIDRPVDGPAMPKASDRAVSLIRTRKTLVQSTVDLAIRAGEIRDGVEIVIF